MSGEVTKIGCISELNLITSLNVAASRSNSFPPYSPFTTFASTSARIADDRRYVPRCLSSSVSARSFASIGHTGYKVNSFTRERAVGEGLLLIARLASYGVTNVAENQIDFEARFLHVLQQCFHIRAVRAGAVCCREAMLSRISNQHIVLGFDSRQSTRNTHVAGSAG